jgi:hypothetical protein
MIEARRKPGFVFLGPCDALPQYPPFPGLQGGRMMATEWPVAA